MLVVPVQAVKVVQLVLGVLMFLLGAALVVAGAACPHVDTPVAAAAHHYRSSYRQSAFHGSRNEYQLLVLVNAEKYLNYLFSKQQMYSSKDRT
jgi:hypothetical protein